MESTAFFEKKLSITPSEFNKVKFNSIDELLQKKAKESMENKCSEQGFVLPGSIQLISRSMGYFESARFTGDAVYYVKLEGKVIYPIDGKRIVGEVIRKNKMGLYVDYRNAIRIQVPRDLHLGNMEYDQVALGDKVEVELKRSKFAIYDTYILASGVFHSRVSSNVQAPFEDESVGVELSEEEAVTQGRNRLIRMQSEIDEDTRRIEAEQKADASESDE